MYMCFLQLLWLFDEHKISFFVMISSFSQKFIYSLIILYAFKFHQFKYVLFCSDLYLKNFYIFSLDNDVKTNKLSQPAVLESPSTEASTITKSLPSPELRKTKLTLLDLYSGCGGMSTGLCLGSKVSSVNLVAVLYMKSIFYWNHLYPQITLTIICDTLIFYFYFFLSAMGCW
jgi:hypothetical protein